jgi:hypothetical protein
MGCGNAYGNKQSFCGAASLSSARNACNAARRRGIGAIRRNNGIGAAAVCLLATTRRRRICSVCWLHAVPHIILFAVTTLLACGAWRHLAAQESVTLGKWPYSRPVALSLEAYGSSAVCWRSRK